jgi:AhpD family alkylhydroperoxidase
MVRTMANSSAVLGGYLELSRAMKRAKLDRRVSERVSIAIQQRLGCPSCLAAHVDAARQHGVDDDEIERAVAGTSSDPAIAAMVGFGLQVLSEPATVDDGVTSRLRACGYSDREIADVIGVVPSTC